MTITVNGSTGITFPDGTSDAGRLLSVRAFTIANTGQTYTPTPGTKSVIVEAVGGGGGGGSTYNTGAGLPAAGSGGSSGSYGRSKFTSAFSGVTLTIGVGGNGGSANASNATAGGTTSFGSLLICPGGGPGQSSGPCGATTIINGARTGALPTGANISISATAGSFGWVANNGWSSGGGGSSPLGVGGITGFGTTAGSNASGYGAGGGGATDPSTAGQPGGNGTPGVIIVWEYA